MESLKEIEKISNLHKKITKKRKKLKFRDFLTDFFIYFLTKIILIITMVYYKDSNKISFLVIFVIIFSIFIAEIIKSENLNTFVKFKFLKDEELEYIKNLKKKYGGLYLKRARSHYFLLHEVRFIIQKINYQELKKIKEKVIELFEEKDKIFIKNIINKIEYIENKKLREQRMLKKL